MRFRLLHLVLVAGLLALSGLLHGMWTNRWSATSTSEGKNLLQVSGIPEGEVNVIEARIPEYETRITSGCSLTDCRFDGLDRSGRSQIAVLLVPQLHRRGALGGQVRGGSEQPNPGTNDFFSH